MKLDLEFKTTFSLCTFGDCQWSVPIICEKNGSGMALCLAHLHKLPNMNWGEAFINDTCTGTLRDAVIAEFYRVFPESEPEPLVPCPVCGKQPTEAHPLHRYRCFHKGTPQSHFSVLCSLRNSCDSEPEARAAWNSMRREPVVNAADAPKTKWQVWNLTHNSPLTATCTPPALLFDSRDEAIAQRDSFRKSFPVCAYEVREVSA